MVLLPYRAQGLTWRIRASHITGSRRGVRCEVQAADDLPRVPEDRAAGPDAVRHQHLAVGPRGVGRDVVRHPGGRDVVRHPGGHLA